MRLLVRAVEIGTFLILVPVSALWMIVAAYYAPLWLDLIDIAWVALNLICLVILTWTPPTRKEGE